MSSFQHEVIAHNRVLNDADIKRPKGTDSVLANYLLGFSSGLPTSQLCTFICDLASTEVPQTQRKNSRKRLDWSLVDIQRTLAFSL